MTRPALAMQWWVEVPPVNKGSSSLWLLLREGTTDARVVKAGAKSWQVEFRSGTVRWLPARHPKSDKLPYGRVRLWRSAEAAKAWAMEATRNKEYGQ